MKNVLQYLPVLMLLASCAATRPTSTVPSASKPSDKKEVRFLDNINVGVEAGKVNQENHNTSVKKDKPANQAIFATEKEKDEEKPPTIEAATAIQVKYALLLDTEVEEIRNLRLFEFIDEWFGTPYRLGGSSRSGIDCSAFTQLLFSAIFAVNIPRTAREQYNKCSKVSRTHLRQGDLVFFNTRGGVSHVGVYLQNNKFVHASASGGVTISDLYDPYWLRRFVGVGRLDLANVAGLL